jgi:myosin heavy subunit
MNGKGLWIIAVISMFLFSGCASLKCLDGSCERQIKELEVTSGDLKKEIAKLDAANKEKEQILGLKQDEVTKVQNEKTALNAQVKDLQDEMTRMKKEREAIKSETIAEKQTTQKAEGAAGAPGKEAVDKEGLAAPVRIKVLAGDGKMSSGRIIARKLEKNGLKVEIVDLAPRSDFLTPVVYYTPEVEKEAKEIAGLLGKNATTKPLTWSSAFNIIVVTGKRK